MHPGVPAGDTKHFNTFKNILSLKTNFFGVYASPSVTIVTLHGFGVIDKISFDGAIFIAEVGYARVDIGDGGSECTMHQGRGFCYW